MCSWWLSGVIHVNMDYRSATKQYDAALGVLGGVTG